MDRKIKTTFRQNAFGSRFQKACKKAAFLPLILLSLASASCAMTPSKPAPPPAQANEGERLKKVESLYKSGKFKKALALIDKIMETGNGTDVADDAQILKGKIFCQQRSYTDCYRAYISVIQSQYSSPREAEARFGAAQALYKLGRYDEALNLTMILTKARLDVSAKLKVYNLHYKILQQTGDRIEALRTLVYLTKHAIKPAIKSKYKIRSSELVESQLSQNELKIIANSSSFGFLRPVALYKLGAGYFEQRDYRRAEDAFEKLQSLAPNSDLSLNAADYLRQMSARKKVNPTVIGAILPLSGKYSSVGYKTLHGLEYGLGIRDKNPSNFKLAVVDSAGSPDLARRGVERLIVENSAVAIVGDIVSRSAEVVAQKSDELGVPNIGLSQKSGITEVGPFVFQNALTSSAQVKALVKAAIEEHGLKRFAIVYPNNGYGTEYANLFWDEVLARGGEIRGAQTYSPDEKDFRGAIQRLVGTFYIEDRQSEFEHLLGEWYGKQKVVNSRTQAPDDLLSPIIDFDAIFIPDGSRTVGQIASMLVFNDVNEVRLMGTNLWNTPDIVSRGTKLMENSLFVDAQFAVTKAWRNSNFSRNFQRIYGHAPSIFEAQAYDVAFALRNIISSGARSRRAVQEALNSLKDFPGSLGALSVNNYREFSRPITVLSVHEGSIKKAVPAPETSSN